MMNNFVIIPLLIPFVVGVVLIFFKDNIKLQRIISTISLIATTGFAAYLVQLVYKEGILTHKLGNWDPPFGIILVADMLAALLVLTASIVALCCILFAFRSIGEKRERFYFYPLVHFLMVGVFGAFLTGDIFNLFVFFEVMLMSSYALIVIGGTRAQLRESLKYILVNVISSALFVITVAYLYSVTGTLNMADLSQRVAEVNQPGILTTIGVLFFIVFGLKAALFPMYFWLPSAYNAPPPVVTALFGALLTKVGIYSIFRTFTLIFYHQPEVTHQLIGYTALLTIVIGTVGAIAYNDMNKILIYNIVIAVGVIVYGITLTTPAGIEGAIYYLIHDMIIKAALFLLGGAIIAITGTSKLKEMGGLIQRHPQLGWMFFVAVVSLAGIPPLSGFVGKFLLVQGGLESQSYTFVIVLLVSSLMVLYSAMKIFMNCFWRAPKLTEEQEKGSTKGMLYPSAILLAISIFLGLGAEVVFPYISMAAETLMDPSIYIESVLKE
ncbi:Na+/H+ antiporter subunit D [Priestia flexa]|uniref:Cation:proton antiporter n=2 Tax=Priestia TaxID=2800373 RepID=A0A0V8JK30_9BACI|nr:MULTISPECIES: Na+/H+ antiporter subunit D [Bacillaceae]AQX53378.1 Na+/H+ antiporter subunit D [Priestia flexa]KSU87390.1 cation:proton antiporter [Priestia veravalensis]KZB91101.1 Na+/H+ antiporter subunit D [Bacillus sp. VT 712]MBN8253133.1 Na+/H+ antiporter subunit D [Priestia flexa]MBN8433772.1 Na+/H+ antiporter subunit D [Priestia flexa]